MKILKLVTWDDNITVITVVRSEIGQCNVTKLSKLSLVIGYGSNWW